MKIFYERLEQKNLLAANFVADINQVSSLSSNPRDFATVGNLTYFVADSELGAELWKTDGTAAGTSVVKDIVPGRDGSHPVVSAALEKALLFQIGDQVWRTDGSEESTTPVAGIGEILAATQSLAFGAELAITDGTSGEARPIVASDGAVVRAPIDVVVVEDSFAFNTPASNFWQVDATGTATFLGRVTRARPMVVDDDVMAVRNTAGRIELVHLASESAGDPIVVPGEIVDFDDMLRVGSITFFQVRDDNTLSLWRTDGTQSGTFAVAEFPADNPFFDRVLSDAVASDEAVWFIGTNQLGRELWKSDGTKAGTGPVRDIFRGSLGANPANMVVDDNQQLWFVADDGVSGRQVWTSDGTENGTRRVTSFPKSLFGDNEPVPLLLEVQGGQVFFQADSNSGVELWVSDGSRSGTRQLADLNPGIASSFPTGVTASSHGALFFAAAGPTGNELWQTDGTAEGTSLVRDIFAGTTTNGSQPNDLTVVGDKLYFTADDGIHGPELWSFDGISSTLVADIAIGSSGSAPEQLTAVGDVLYFVADDGPRGRELWKADEFGARIVDDVAEGPGSSNPAQLTELNGRLYFIANVTGPTAAPGDAAGDFLAKRGLWSTGGVGARLEFASESDGDARTPPGTVDELTRFDDSLYFYELNVTRRDTLNLHKLSRDSHEIINTGNFRGETFIEANSEFLLFAGPTSESTRSGVHIVTPGAAPVTVETPRLTGRIETISVGSSIYVHSNRRSLLFSSDGTADAVRVERIRDAITIGDETFAVEDAGRVKKILVGDLRESPRQAARFSSEFGFDKDRPQNLTSWNGELYFTVNDPDGVAGVQIWKSDGTPGGTSMVTKFGPNRQGAEPDSLVVFNDALYFSANDELRGRELWAYVAPEQTQGDINSDDVVNAIDIDTVFAAVRDGSTQPDFDLDNDGVVDLEDANFFVESVLGVNRGDTDLDGQVDFHDFLRLSVAFEVGPGGWGSGDFDGDRDVDFDDFRLLSANFG